MPMSAMGEPSEAGEGPSSPTLSAWIQNMPLALHTCTQPPRSDEATTACANVGASVAKAMASMASQVVNRR